MDNLTTKLIAQLKRDEDAQHKEGDPFWPFTDTVGKLTIGVGRNLTDKGISQAEADFMLANDISEALAQLQQAWPWTDNIAEARRGALANLLFNMGFANLKGFVNMLGYARAGMWTEAAKHLLQSKYATQVGDRAVRLAKQLETGEWQ